MASAPNRRAVRWLRSELPGLVAAGVLSEENARALEAHYLTRDERSPQFAVVLLSSLGSALVAAGLLLLIAHNWDEFSRPLRSVFAFLPLLAAQGLTLFVLLRREQAKAWRESAAIFQVAAVGAAISLVSQTYQITGSLADFFLVWLLLGVPLVYLLRTTLGAIAYLIGALVWLLVKEKMRGFDPLAFWFLLALIVPFFGWLYQRARGSRETAAFAIAFAAVAAVGLAFTASFARANFGVLAFAGYFAVVYLGGVQFFPSSKSDRLHPLAVLGAVAIGVMTIVLTFEDNWRAAVVTLWPLETPRLLASVILLFFPVAAIALAGWQFLQRQVRFSLLAAAFPLVVGLGWIMASRCERADNYAPATRCDFFAALLLDLYAFALGVELIARGVRAESVSRANFGLLIIAALAVARFFDSDLSFVVRASGFIVIGLGFLATNFLLFRKRRAA